MYPKTHLYFAQKLFELDSPAFILGCIFPDVAGVAGISREFSHACGRRLLREWKKPLQAEFALGVATHGNDPQGLDYYGDEKYLDFEKGYCFAKSRLIEKETIALGIPPEMAWWKGHNIVEMAIEIWVSQQGAYGQKIFQALADSEVKQQLIPALAEFFVCPWENIARSLEIFQGFIDEGVSTPQSMAAIFVRQMAMRHQINLDLTATAQLIAQAGDLTDLDEFWLNIAQPVKKAILLERKADLEN